MCVIGESPITYFESGVSLFELSVACVDDWPTPGELSLSESFIGRLYQLPTCSQRTLKNPCPIPMPIIGRLGSSLAVFREIIVRY